MILPEARPIACSKFLVGPRFEGLMNTLTGKGIAAAHELRRSTVSSIDRSSQTTTSSGGSCWEAMLSNCSVRYGEPL
jgi:hypothetical protein